MSYMTYITIGIIAPIIIIVLIGIAIASVYYFHKSKKNRGNNMNTYIKLQLQNMTAMVKTFEQSCVMAAQKDDGIIDEQEQATIKRIQKATSNFLKELEKIK